MSRLIKILFALVLATFLIAALWLASDVDRVPPPPPFDPDAPVELRSEVADPIDVELDK